MKLPAARVQQGLASITAVAVLLLLSIVFPHAFPRGVIVQGAIFGLAAGLLAVGLVLVYRTTRVINFAYGAVGATAAEVGIVAHQKLHLPWGLCVAIAVLAGALIGLGFDLVMRRFEKAPRLVVTVATIGLLQLLVGVQFGVAFWSHANPLVAPFSTGLSANHFAIDKTLFNGNDLIAFALVPVVLLGLFLFLTRTDSGTAIRGLAENMDRAKLLGIPIRRLSRLVWVVVGCLAAAIMILNAPTNGLPISPFVSAGGIFMPALAAAVIAKMDELTTAVLAGIGLGIFNSIASFNVHKSSLETVALLVVILAALLLRRWSGTRAQSAESSWSSAGVGRQLPAAVARLPEIVVGRIGILLSLAVAAVIFPLVAPPSDVHTVAGYLVLGIAALSLVVLSGWSGNINLGQFAIVGVGGVVAGDLIVKANIDLFFALAIAALAGGIISIVVGLPALRVRPVFLAVTTLAFAAAMDQFFLNPTNYPSLIPGSILRPALWKRFPLESERATYFLCLGFLVVAILAVHALQRSRPGRVLRATRDNQRASASLTVAGTRTRVTGMLVAGMVAGVAGGLWALLQNGIGASSFRTQDSVLLFSMTVVGGLSSISGSLSGVAVTALLIFGIGQISPQGTQFASLGTGILLLGVLMVFPGGLAQALERLRDSIAARVGARHGVQLTVGSADRSVEAHAPSSASPSHAPVKNALLSCRDLVASYGSLQVLFGVELSVRDGEIVALVGTNGAGKSTVFRALTGLMPSAGSVQFDGESLAGLPTDSIARKGIAMMPGGRGVFPGLTVAENLRLGCWQLRKDSGALQWSEERMLDLFPALRPRLGQLAGNLSGGEQQQLSLAMAFATGPKLLLIDELSLGLAPTVVTQLCENVRAIHAAGTTVVLVEQSVSVALQLAERALFLEKGTVRFEGPTIELLSRPDLLRSVFIAGPTEINTKSAVREISPSHEPELLELSCHSITKRYGGIAAIDDLDVKIRPGAITGLIGHNGAGKTTLFDVISGFEAISAGRVMLGETDITAEPPHKRAIAGLGRSFQEARLFPSLTVTETIMLALDHHLRSHDWVAAALASPPSTDSESAAYERASQVMELLGLLGYADTLVADLSTGTKRILELACIVALEPAIVLLDEPTAGVAQKEVEALVPLLRKVRKETRSTIVIIEHDMGLLTALCDELIALELGRVICTGAPQTVLNDPRVVESYLGTDDWDGTPPGSDNGGKAHSSRGKRLRVGRVKLKPQ